MLKAITAALALAASTLPVHADEANAVGIGVSQCARLTEMYRSAPPNGVQLADAMLGSWIGGYETATNTILSFQHKDTKNIGAVTLEQQIIGVRKYCKHNPNAQVMDGVLDFLTSLPSMADGE
jgi:hypothetical protein